MKLNKDVGLSDNGHDLTTINKMPTKLYYKDIPILDYLKEIRDFISIGNKEPAIKKLDELIGELEILEGSDE